MPQQTSFAIYYDGVECTVIGDKASDGSCEYASPVFSLPDVNSHPVASRRLWRVGRQRVR